MKTDSHVFLVDIQMIITYFWPLSRPKTSMDRSLSLEELSELLYYEEIEVDDALLLPGEVAAAGAAEGNTRHPYGRSGIAAGVPASVRMMHSFVPTNPFKATVRIRRSSSGSASSLQPLLRSSSDGSSAAWSINSPKTRRSNSSSRLVATSSSNAADSIISSEFLLGADSPASFPATPFSRAYVMNRSSEKVVSVMFAARDRLRLEQQGLSRDEFCRMAAREAKTSGQFAVFDASSQAALNSGIALSCGNHCAIKVGQGLCCCCRSMAPVRTNAYVYFEFSITVSSAQVPTLGIGLAPLDCPLNVMVGSWPRSVGLYSDGQIMIGSHWFQSLSGEKCVAGSTVGVLVFVGSGTPPAVAAVGADTVQGIAIPSAPTDAPLPNPLLSKLKDAGPLRGGSRHNSPSVSRLPPLYEDGEQRGSRKQVGRKHLVLPVTTAPDTSVASASVSSSAASDPVAEGAADSSSYECRVEPPAEPSAADLSPLSGKQTPPTAAVAQDGGAKSDRVAVAEERSLPILVRFNVNGKVVACPEEVQDNIRGINSGGAGDAAAAVSLYPTISLFSEDTRVWCRFCEADVVYRHRAQIGAPPGVRVYCLDGSLLLQETD